LNRINDLVPGFRVSGSLKFKGQDIYGAGVDPIGIRLRIGMVFQKPNPFPKSIYDNVAYGPRLCGITDRPQLDALVEESLKQAAIWDEVKDKLRHMAWALSGGQQQRLCIGRLRSNPRFCCWMNPRPRSTPLPRPRSRSSWLT
jgi:phosphate transport system ATP-binding protein